MTVEYFDQEADRYDDLVRYTQEDYDLSHQVLLDLTAQFLDTLDKASILILGCGTGEEVARLLQRDDLPQLDLVLVDGSRQMLDQAKARLETLVEKRRASIRFVEGDLRNTKKLIQRMKTEELPNEFNTIVSAYTLHHFADAEKSELFEAIRSVLAIDGFFLNLDLFVHEDAKVQEVCRERSLAWLDVAGREEWSQADVQRWRAHISFENLPLAITATGTKISETSLLRKAGFRRISVPYRFFETGIMVARS